MLRSTLIVIGAAAAMLPSLLQAESSNMNGAGTLSTSARLDFEVIVPRFLLLQIGSSGGTIDLISFNLNDRLTAGGYPGDGIDVTGTGGDVGSGVVTARVASNAGQITITPSADVTGLTDGGSNSIPFSEILTISSDANLPAPALTNGTGAAVSVTLSGGNRTNRTANWTYRFDNAGSYEAGTYGGANVNGGRVVYTAASP